MLQLDRSIPSLFHQILEPPPISRCLAEFEPEGFTNWWDEASQPPSPCSANLYQSLSRFVCASTTTHACLVRLNSSDRFVGASSQKMKIPQSSILLNTALMSEAAVHIRSCGKIKQPHLVRLNGPCGRGMVIMHHISHDDAHKH